MANNIFSGIGSRSPIDGESRMASSVMESISKLPSFTEDAEIQRFQRGGFAGDEDFYSNPLPYGLYPMGEQFDISSMYAPSLTPYMPETLNQMWGSVYDPYESERDPTEWLDFDPWNRDPQMDPFRPISQSWEDDFRFNVGDWGDWTGSGIRADDADIYGTPTPEWYDPTSTWFYPPEPAPPTTYGGVPPTGTPQPGDPEFVGPPEPVIPSDPVNVGSAEGEPGMEEITVTGQQPSWWQNWFPWMAGLGTMAGLGGIGGGASAATGAGTETTTIDPTTGEEIVIGEPATGAGGVLSGIGPPGLGAIPLIAGAVATEEENGGDPYIPQAQPYIPPMGSLIPSQVTSENPFVYSPLDVGDYASISGYLDPRTMGGDLLGYTPYLGSGIGGLLPQSEYVPGVSDMWNDNWAYPMSMESMDPSWRPSMPWELSNMPADLYTQPPPPPPDPVTPPVTPPPVTPPVTPVSPVTPPVTPRTPLTPRTPVTPQRMQFDPETYDWSGIMNQYQPQIPTMPDLSQYALKTDLPTLPTMPEMPGVTQFDPQTYDWSGIMSQYQPTMPEIPDLSPYALKADMPTTPTIPGQFDPIGYDWGNIFNQYQQNVPEMPEIPSIPSAFDPTGYDWGGIFGQYQQEMPEMPSYDVFNPIGYDWGGVFNQYQQEMPSYNAFDPSGYDFQNIFNQYQQEMPSFAMPDLSGYLTQGDLTAGLGSLPNYNAQIRALSDRMNALNSRFDNYQPTQNYNQPGLGLFT